ncbi:hypothetical protein [Borreliella bavariensis]|uniref:hypothetical protein n=1 Tax=Borreliella bavariensis TaxID=664662 RepID=UPI001F1A17BF|nr:hypothetical protein [Borreliella bavariensis]
MGKKVILILLGILILSCNHLLDQDQKTKTSKNQEQKLKEIGKDVDKQYLNYIYRFQIKNNKDCYSIDYNKVSIGENYIELDLLSHNQVFKMSKILLKS